ncbi:MAG TPA: RloB domain-containing protein [Gammaproteobacteria bacterium]|nr:RloB domain-containing protein [Gammaproteobacteria bacterium]
MPSHGRRVARHTVLLVGEGTTECAFLKHIKALYISRGCGVSAAIRNAHGKGPDHVVDYAIRQCRNAAYDRVVVLLDTDLAMSAAVRKRARSRKIQVIGSTPCVEGLLLSILGERVPGNSAACKAQCGRALPARLTAPEDYQTHFPKDVLDGRRADVSELDELLKCLLFDK